MELNPEHSEFLRTLEQDFQQMRAQQKAEQEQSRLIAERKKVIDDVSETVITSGIILGAGTGLRLVGDSMSVFKPDSVTHINVTDTFGSLLNLGGTVCQALGILGIAGSLAAGYWRYKRT